MQVPVSRSRSDWPTMFLHWGMVAALLLSVSTGWRIAGLGDSSALWRWVDVLVLQGNVSRWHFASALALCGLIGAYLIFLAYARLGGRLRLRTASLRDPDRTTRWSAVNKAIYWMALLLLGASLFSGMLLYFFPGLLPTEALARAHQWLSWGFVAYIGLHVVAQLVMGGPWQLVKMFLPRPAYGVAALVALAGGAAVAGGLWLGDMGRVQTLELARAGQIPMLDGDPADPAWELAREQVVHTARGMGLNGGEVDVRVRALHDGEYAYFLFRWADATRSQKHIPLVKTGQGWKLMQTAYGKNDENDYYEDKFAVMLARSPVAGGNTAHLGARPLDGKPGPSNGLGLHYSEDGSLADVWHWKGVRSAATGQFDDNYFGAPLEVKPGKRYTGGYSQDPKTGGGFEENFVRRPGSDLVEVKFLPRDLAAQQARMGRFDPDPKVSDEGEFAMHKRDTQPYSAAIDAAIPVGTVIPSVLFDLPFAGDRGDVAAAASWKDGEWRLEARRKLDTGSRFDQPIGNGMFMWLAVFDHNQVRHTRHVHPLRLAIQ